ncbi:MAG: hypothetical protein GY806_22550 [Gammaproteobacteria bacterium]|nr:hypothetical protein [Gammaproteobacteria bacterium]
MHRRNLPLTHYEPSKQELGTKLFQRINRGLILTAQGDVLFPVLLDCFDRISASLDNIRHEFIEWIRTA